jgi:hypothetical protein
MFFLRFVLIAFMAAYSWSMGHQGPLNAFGNFIAFTFLFFGPALYLLPTYEAWKRKHPNLTAIALVNLFLGWTLIGWVVSVVWAYKNPEPVTVFTSQGPEVPSPSSPVAETKKCPFCAEDVLVAAIKCKHCGSQLPATS